MNGITKFVLGHKVMICITLAPTRRGGRSHGGDDHQSTVGRLTVPGSPAFQTDNRIEALYHNGAAGAGYEPTIPVITLPAGQTVDTPGVRAQLGIAFASVTQAIPNSRIVDYATTGDRSFVTSDGRSTFALVFPPSPPDGDKFTQAMGRALPPTARTMDVWLITGGRRVNTGAAAAVLSRFQIGTMMIADPDPWSASLRGVVQQAQSAGLRVAPVNGPLEVDGVRLSLATDGRSWLIQTGHAVLAVVPPETTWLSLPADLDGAIFTTGGPRVAGTGSRL